MTDTYKCMVCGYTANMPGDHCGQPMVKQVPPVTDAGSAAPAPTESAPASNADTATPEAPSEPSTSTDTPAANPNNP